jgi:hypothetical protein
MLILMQVIADNRHFGGDNPHSNQYPRVSTSVTHLRHAGFLTPFIAGGQSKFEMQLLRHQYRSLI